MQLPPHEQISHPKIREAAAAMDAATTANEQARRDLTEAEQTLPQSEDVDAAAAAEARLAKKPEPKTRANTLKHEARIRALAHELKVRQVIVQRSRESLNAALEQHGGEWIEEGRAAIRAANVAWDEALTALLGAQERRAVLLAALPGVRNAEQVCALKKRQIHGPEFRPQPADQQVDPHIYVSDMLAALKSLDMLHNEVTVELPAARVPQSREQIEENNRRAEERRRRGVESDNAYIARKSAEAEEERRERQANRSGGFSDGPDWFEAQAEDRKREIEARGGRATTALDPVLDQQPVEREPEWDPSIAGTIAKRRARSAEQAAAGANVDVE